MCFLGYASHHKGYQLLNLDSNTVFVSWDVKFYEYDYPFAVDHHHYNFELPNDHSSILNPISTLTPTTCSNSNPSLKPTRTIHKPHWLQDYICAYLDPHSALINDYRQKVNTIIDQEPMSYTQANKVKE